MARSRKDEDLEDVVPRPKSDAYTGLLVLALLAQVAGAIFLILDYNQYPEKAPKKVQDRPPASAPANPPAPQPQPGGDGKDAPKKAEEKKM